MKFNYNNIENNSIFHYTTLQKGLELILPTKKLRINPIVKTNDPRENKTFGFSGINPPFSKDNFIQEQREWNKEISSRLRNNTKVLCFSTDYEIIDNKNNVSEQFDGYNLSRMWAQYGENHHGICIDIDRDLLKKENNIDDNYFQKMNYNTTVNFPSINYDRIKEIGIDDYILEYRETNLTELFFTKAIDWETEHEFRLVQFSSYNENTFISIEKSIKRIILGIDFKMEYLPSIIKNADSIPIEKISFENNTLISLRFREDFIKNTMSYLNGNKS